MTQTKFKIGSTAWFMSQNRIERGLVYRIITDEHFNPNASTRKIYIGSFINDKMDTKKRFMDLAELNDWAVFETRDLLIEHLSKTAR